MTIKVTVANEEQVGGRSILVTESSGTGHQVGPGQSISVYVHSGNGLTVVEIEGTAQPEGGGGPGEER